MYPHLPNMYRVLIEKRVKNKKRIMEEIVAFCVGGRFFTTTRGDFHKAIVATVVGTVVAT